jgi:hypothetical protein
MDIKLNPQHGYLPAKSHSAGDNTMYWGIMSHDKAGYYFRNDSKTLSEVGAYLSKEKIHVRTLEERSVRR